VSDAFDPMNPMNPLSAINALNTATRALMDNIKRAGFPPLHQQGAQMARQSYRMGVGASEVPRAPMARIENFSIPARSGHSIPARLWAPLDAPGLPVMLYLHGGGFVIGGIDTCEAMCRSVAAQSGVAVVAIDYRLAPEHKYPAALDDTWDAIEWLRREGASLGLDASRLALGGDSAGGTLAASAALMCRDAGVPLRLQAMFYPSVQLSLQTDSFKAFSKGLMLDAELMAWFDAQYQVPGQALDWRREPLKAASHAGVAPAWIGLAQCDPLADDGRLYAAALEKAGVSAAVKVYEGTVHDFINMGRFLPQAAQAHADMAQALRHALA
jgi:acetyl esterase